ncbi:microtubule-actin cross-linking factor 1-like [Salvelinus alpinus]|uniref:microtubule-actin cross-linking factor 1-like n=1 Tax=Salvelinus alpinus TaxID=8036 RepID=UPI0039FC35F8
MEELKESTKRYPLLRAASEESSSELSSFPFPGDTLPWNLPKHHRIKRSKSASGDVHVHVLDPAERAVFRIADERDRVQKKTFTKWVNKHLMKGRHPASHLGEPDRPAEAWEPDDPAEVWESDEPAEAWEPDKPVEMLEPNEPAEE